MATTFRLNPARVAYYEANGWRAYYEHNWLQLLRLIVGLCQEQFHIPFPVSLLAAYYTTRASVAWAPVNHDVRKVEAYLYKFYSVARRYSGLQFDVERVAALELQYFDVHRRLSIAGQEDKSEFIHTMAELHSAIFGITPDQARESAELRVLAGNTVDLITSKTSANPASDWAKLEEYLRQCYASIVRERAA
ncbi:MAG TPA: hypothetical protein VEV19_01045 [Ktedonobacteraceae bacterium]|nr:hypothetical protein [Ktedonobacteraceae bacterium]